MTDSAATPRAQEDAPTVRPVDRYGRAIFQAREVPDPWTPESCFAQWFGRTCGPWIVIRLTIVEHATFCFKGWTRSGEWWYVCGRCHPDAVDMPGSSAHQGAQSEDAS